MATTTPREFLGSPRLTPVKVETIRTWYTEALGDEDKCTEADLGAFYEGQRMAFESVLDLLHQRG